MVSHRGLAGWQWSDCTSACSFDSEFFNCTSVLVQVDYETIASSGAGHQHLSDSYFDVTFCEWGRVSVLYPTLDFRPRLLPYVTEPFSLFEGFVQIAEELEEDHPTYRKYEVRGADIRRA